MSGSETTSVATCVAAAIATLLGEVLLYHARDAPKAKAVTQSLFFHVGCWGAMGASDWSRVNYKVLDMFTPRASSGASLFLACYAGHVAFLWLELLLLPHKTHGEASSRAKARRQSKGVMAFHHAVTTALVAIAYQYQFLRAGAHVVWLLSPSEALLCLRHDARSALAKRSVDVLFVVAWFWGRVFHYSRFTARAWIEYVEGTPAFSASSVLVLTADLGMQLWWSVEIVRRVASRRMTKPPDKPDTPDKPDKPDKAD